MDIRKLLQNYRQKWGIRKIFIGFVVEHGMEITQGVPIIIDVYPKQSAEYRNFLFPPKSIIEVEVR